MSRFREEGRKRCFEEQTEGPKGKMEKQQERQTTPKNDGIEIETEVEFIFSQKKNGDWNLKTLQFS